MLLLVVEVKKLVYTPYARVLLQKNMDMQVPSIWTCILIAGNYEGCIYYIILNTQYLHKFIQADPLKEEKTENLIQPGDRVCL